MSLPKYRPKHFYHPAETYAERVAGYGRAPRGYRWLKIGEIMPKGCIFADRAYETWAETMVSGEVFLGRGYATACPSKAAVTNNTSATLTVRQCAEQFRMYAESHPSKDSRHSLRFCAEFLEKQCRDYA